MNIDKDIIGKPPNQAIVINDKLINRQSKEKEDHSKDNKALSDSRERLEADVRGAVHGAYAYEDYIPENMIFDWLDRQAAITAEETSNAWEEYRDATQREIDELTAERDELQKRLLAALNTADTIAKDTNDIKKERDRLVDERYRYKLQCERWESKIAMLEAERDHLKKVVQQQAESFRKMEVELSKAKAVSNECDGTD